MGGNMAKLVVNQNKKPTKIVTPANLPKIIQFYVNDPSTPQIMDTINVSEVDKLLFNVVGYGIPSNNFTTGQGIASNCCGVLNYNINNVYNAFADYKIKNWSTVKTLYVKPLAGNMANAFYDRKGLSFFYFKDSAKKTIYTALSADVVSHELGHAILDYLRPEFWNTVSLEIFAFHEAFGDVFAFLCSIHHEKIIDFVINETGGDLTKSNVVSKIGEQFGLGLGLGGYLRNVDNDLKYVNPSMLPSGSSDKEALTKEPHNFSRVISGTIYKIFADIFMANGKNKAAFILARNFTRDIFFKASKQAPATSNFSIGFAKILTQVAQNINPNLSSIVYNVCKNRNLLAENEIKTNLTNNYDKMLISEEYNDDLDVKIYDHLVKLDDIIHTKKHKCLSGVKVKIPCDDIQFKNESFGFAGEYSDLNTSIECATEAVNYMIEKGLLGDVWSVNNENILNRNIIKCDGFVNNCTIEGQPEYKKCWKYRISGCGCGGPYGCPPEKKKIQNNVANFCGSNYSIKCSSTRTSSCQVR